MSRATRLTAVSAVLAVIASGIAGGTATASADRAPRHGSRLVPLHAVNGDRPAIVDARGRQVTLRGQNVNSLGDYYQADPKLPPVLPVTAKDWARMQSHGFNVVRLLVSWSRLEPKRGTINRAYLRRIHRAIDAARARGIYTVIDLHQDAWGKYIASPPDVVCPAGKEPAIGWDGAPKWATITDGAETCRGGSREDSAAVQAAFDNFYADRDGIQTALVNTWGRVAREFAGDPAVAGYDLFNEPNPGTLADATERLATYYSSAIDAIRGAERARKARPAMIFFETTVYGVAVEPGFTTDTNLVFEGHNYGEATEGIFDYFQSRADAYGTPLWIGEYGWFSEPNVTKANLGRFSAKADALLSAGEAWWQWRQACGDPHSLNNPERIPDPVLVHFQRNRCPGDQNLGIVPQWACTWRPYPRATPGRLTERRADCAGNLTFRGTTDRVGTFEVWYPGRARPTVTGTNVSAITRTRVRGGWSVTGKVHDDYTVQATSP